MKEYIERAAALQPVFDACTECMEACIEFDGIYADCNECMLDGVKLKLRDLPAADVRPVVRGQWLNDFCGKGRFSKRIVQCSLCGNFLDLDGVNAGRGDANYCPNCGAMMEEN